MSDSPMLVVKRCICFQRTFAEIKVLCEQNVWTTIAEIACGTGCSTGCGLCRPYLARMLFTGDTEFPILSADHETEETG